MLSTANQAAAAEDDRFQASTLLAPGEAGSAQADRLRLLMKHPKTGDQQIIPIGYSVPVLLAGPVPLLLRRNWGLAALCIVLPILGQILLAPHANRLHIRHLLKRGYRAVSTEPGRVSHIEWLLGMQLPRYGGRRSSAPSA